MREVALFVHITSAIVLAGDLIYGSAWLAGSLRAPDGARLRSYVQASLRVTGRRLALPAMLLLLLSGFYLVHLGRFSIVGSSWLIASLVLFLVLSGLWHGMLIPLRRRMERAAADGVDYARLARRWISVSGMVLALNAAILALMIAKPRL